MHLLDAPQGAIREKKSAPFCFGAVYCGMSDGCIVRLVRRFYCYYCVHWSVKIAVWFLWYCYLHDDMILVCIRFHIIFVSCDIIMKCIFLDPSGQWTTTSITEGNPKFALPLLCQENRLWMSSYRKALYESLPRDDSIVNLINCTVGICSAL